MRRETTSAGPAHQHGSTPHMEKDQPVFGPTPINAALAHFPYYTLLHIEVSPVTGQSSETKHTLTRDHVYKYVCVLSFLFHGLGLMGKSAGKNVANQVRNPIRRKLRPSPTISKGHLASHDSPSSHATRGAGHAQPSRPGEEQSSSTRKGPRLNPKVLRRYPRQRA